MESRNPGKILWQKPWTKVIQVNSSGLMGFPPAPQYGNLKSVPNVETS